MVYLKDVAARAGVSVTQASRALNGYDDVSAATRQKVELAAKELGYVKNIAASALAGGSRGQIAALMVGLEIELGELGTSNIYPLLSGISEYASQNNLEFVSYMIHDSEASFTDFCRKRGLKNVILFGADYDSPNIQDMIKSEITCVVVDIPLEGENKGCVMINDFYYAKLAVTRMIEGGCKNIIMFSGHPHAYVSLARISGYKAALQDAGLTFCKTVDAKFDYYRAAELMPELLEENPEVDGFFCISDYMALGCHSVLSQRGISIPEQISIFGFDGIVASQMVHPTLSTIRQDCFRKGFAAAKLIDDIVQTDGNCEKTVVVPCTLIEGGSVRARVE